MLIRGAGGANLLLSRSGLRVVRATKVIRDVRGQTEDPREAVYRAGLAAFVLDIELAHMRIVPGAAFACTAGCGNPFVETLVGYRDGHVAQYEGSPLEAFYRAWRPRNAAEVLGIATHSTTSRLSDVQPLGFVFPWNDWPPEVAIQRWTSFIEKDNKQFGTKGHSSLGWKAWGPVDRRIGEQEFARLTMVFDSISRRGYERHHGSDGDIKGLVLEKHGEFRVLVTAGHHRAAALAAAKTAVAPVRIDNPIVRFADSRFWPNVRTGLFTHTEAIAVFNRLFDARQPRSYSPVAPSKPMPQVEPALV